MLMKKPSDFHSSLFYPHNGAERGRVGEKIARDFFEGSEDISKQFYKYKPDFLPYQNRFGDLVWKDYVIEVRVVMSKTTEPVLMNLRTCSDAVFVIVFDLIHDKTYYLLIPKENRKTMLFNRKSKRYEEFLISSLTEVNKILRDIPKNTIVLVRHAQQGK